MMEEHIGYCQQCKKEIHCLNGFFNGIVDDQTKTILCFTCADSFNEKSQNA
ncbi:hypothetical protein IM538_05205 [Cytobacillus suaedae]|nr:hypothetical protein IM538_05205 [Cytobacillus suaedae]